MVLGLLNSGYKYRSSPVKQKYHIYWNSIGDNVNPGRSKGEKMKCPSDENIQIFTVLPCLGMYPNKIYKGSLLFVLGL